MFGILEHVLIGMVHDHVLTSEKIAKPLNPCHADYFYVPHSSPVLSLLTCGIPDVTVSIVDPDQTSEAS